MVEELLKSNNSDDVVLAIRILVEELKDKDKIKFHLDDYRLNINPSERIDIFIGNINLCIRNKRIGFYYFIDGEGSELLNAKILKF